MMSSEDNITPNQASKHDNQPSGGRKTSSTRPPDQQPLKCPRCDSPNTKFCYYNNYSLSQPRHFCKTCRRYWTKGGALRNVPIGGGCRKNKKVKSSSSSRDSSSSSEFGGLKFFPGLSSPTMDFQFGGLSLPRLQPSTGSVYNQFSATFGDISSASSAGVSTSCFTLDPSGSCGSLMGFNYNQLHPSGHASSSFTGAVQNMGSMGVNSNLATSIESLSSINQDLHLKLQQQRLAMLYGGEDNQRESNTSGIPFESNQAQRPQPIMFQNLEISKPDGFAVENARKDGPAVATERFFGDPCASVSQAPTSTGGNGNGNENTNNWNGVQAWSDLQQFGTLP